MQSDLVKIVVHESFGAILHATTPDDQQYHNMIIFTFIAYCRFIPILYWSTLGCTLIVHLTDSFPNPATYRGFACFVSFFVATAPRD